MMFGCFTELLLIAGFMWVCTYGGKYLLTFYAVVTGDKEALHDAGSLCSDDPPLDSFKESEKPLHYPYPWKPPPRW